MITVNGKELDFDLTSIEDLQRYRAAVERMSAAAAQAAQPPQDTATSEGFAAYIDYIGQQCRLVTDFIDEIFGEGTCNTLLGPKSSLEKLLKLCSQISAAVDEQGRSFNGMLMQQYLPNRATRRAQK